MAEKRAKKLILFILSYAILISSIHFFRIGGEQYFETVTTLITVITPIIPMYFGFKAVRYFGFKSTQGKSSLFLVLTIILWWLGDLIWWILAQNVVVSLADI